MNCTASSLYRLLFRSYWQTVSKAGQGSSWAGTKGLLVLQISSGHLQILRATVVTCSKLHTDFKQYNLSFWTVHCDMAVWKEQKVPKFYINVSIQLYCLLYVSNIKCSSSGRNVHAVSMAFLSWIHKSSLAGGRMCTIDLRFRGTDVTKRMEEWIN
jgi:hypothetical protein